MKSQRHLFQDAYHQERPFELMLTVQIYFEDRSMLVIVRYVRISLDRTR